MTVLVVDDQRDAADTVATLLSLMGYEARAAYSGRQALQLFNEMQPRVVLMDLGMPEMSGFEAAARIRLMPQGTATTIVALTAWGDDMNRRLSREASIDYHVVKPAAAETLQEVLSRIRAH
jgi:CheY-like chemotaxis protein